MRGEVHERDAAYMHAWSGVRGLRGKEGTGLLPGWALEPGLEGLGI